MPNSSMSATIFFSWQLDTPPTIGRNFLHSALEGACRALGRAKDVEDAPRDALTVDSDTQGEPGQPPIVETILKKIDAAQLFVADMTYIAQSSGGKHSPNPNVLIEYGWALKGKSHSRIISVMNTAFGKPPEIELPFDLRYARWPLGFHLPEDATPEVKTEVKRQLVRDLTSRIRACLRDVPEASEAPRRVPFTDLRAWAIAAGWNGDIHAATVGDNDWGNFCRRLRQAAVDGAVAFTGRRYLYDFGEETDDQPQIPIPQPHFDEYGFDIVQLATADNYDIFTSRLGVAPRDLRGQIFRDLHVDEARARAWLAQGGRPPAPSDVAVRIDTAGTEIGDYVPVCTLAVRNIGSTDFERCLVEMVEFSGTLPPNISLPMTLRTVNQIRSNERGRFLLSAGQEVMIPMAFHRPQRANEWFLVDEHDASHSFSADPTKMLVRIFGGPAPGSALVFINTDAGWRAIPTISTVPSDATLRSLSGRGLDAAAPLTG
jgi:hypothetical protein